MGPLHFGGVRDGAVTRCGSGSKLNVQHWWINTNIRINSINFILTSVCFKKGDLLYTVKEGMIRSRSPLKKFYPEPES
jgi:hypothetical protein